MRLPHAFLLGAVLVLPGSAACQDLVTNGHFDTDINGWTLECCGGFQAWDPLDWQGSTSSGSLRVTTTIVGPPNSTQSRQCITLSPSGTYELGGRIRFPSGQPGGGIASVGLSLYSNTACSGTPLSYTQTAVVGSQTTDTWVDVFLNGLNLGPSTVAIAVVPGVGMTGGTSLSALFDRVRFGHDGTTPVSAQSLTIE